MYGSGNWNASRIKSILGSAPSAIAAGIMFGMGVFMPVIYGVMGFVFGVISAAIYNLVARWIGGIEVE